MSKRSFEEHRTMEAMAQDWYSQLKSYRPPDRSRYFPASGARRVLASDKDSLYYLNLHPCSSQLSHYGRLALATTLVGGASRISVVWLCILLEFPGWKFQRNGIFGKKTKPCCNVFREKEEFLFKIQEEDLWSAYCNLPPCSWNFSPRVRMLVIPNLGIASFKAL